MSGFAVTPGELQGLDGYVESAAEHARDAVARLQVEVAELHWHGPAANAFAIAWHDWLEGARLVLGALDDLGRLVGAAARDYVATDDAVRADVGRSA